MIEFIDIGGPSLLRAAAKNFPSITVACDPDDYSWILAKDNLDLSDRKKLAAKVFSHTSHYDSLIANYLNSSQDFSVDGKLLKKLRYGENPQQEGFWYSSGQQGLQQAEILQGKELSFNNLLDLDAAVSTVLQFHRPAVISVKHNNPCGVGVADDITSACKKSLSADPVSVFGGIIAFNREVNLQCAEQLTQLFLECVVAPSFSEEALGVLSKKKNLRVLRWPELMDFNSSRSASFRSVLGGFLVQSADQVQVDNEWQVVSGDLSSEDMQELKFAWQVCSCLKSNAIAVTGGEQSLGLGMGQVNRVDAVEQALHRAKNFHPDSKSLYLASDAFFPFPDSIEIAAKSSVKAIVQPGGSVKDEEVIAKAKELQVAMVFTGRRHFRH